MHEIVRIWHKNKQQEITKKYHGMGMISKIKKATEKINNKNGKHYGT